MLIFRNRFWKIILPLLSIITLGFFLPQSIQMPVVGATAMDYHPDSFWYYPWGRSVTHKGVDIFADKGTAVHSSVKGIVLFAGELPVGGNVVMVLGPKWRMHYFAHLDEIGTGFFKFSNVAIVFDELPPVKASPVRIGCELE